MIGLDVPSIDEVESKSLPSHRLALSNGMAVIENLDLRTVPAGCYELIALPLRLEGVEASPVRAVLRPLNR
ncbi:cyclase family protein [gut metagenome]|uniref:Cyclase family protein n=1 Tax=gut metagenome TaxID=749906 RepID=J9GJ29_9ZZZZ